MKGSQLAIIGGLALLLVFIAGGASANNTTVDLSSLSDTYGAGNVQRLQNLLNALGAAGLTSEQIRYMLSQALVETGLFTSNPNYNATDNDNNFAGISSGGNLKAYSNINAFVSDWINVLSQSPNYPIQATSITDFNNRLKANGYYTDDINTYGNNLTLYYNLLP